jgi:uncharacterized membrane protein
MAKGKEVNKFIFFTFLFVVVAVLDSFWFGVVAPSFYAEQLNSLLKSQVNIVFAVLAWVCIAFGIYYFVIPRSQSYADALLTGGLFGLVLYAGYNLTNLAMLNNWSVVVSVVDAAWGAVLCAATSLVGFVLATKVFKIK